MNLDELKRILIEAKIFVKDKTKNFICICPYCGDHPNPRKRGHLYVSKKDSIPVFHCFYNNESGPITKLIFDITASRTAAEKVFSKEELENLKNPEKKAQKTISSKIRFRDMKIPVMDISQFPSKSLYIRKRSANLADPEKVPNLIFDFLQFVQLNNLDIIGKDKQLSDFEADLIHKNFVGFLGAHHCILYTRSIDDNGIFKFKKIFLQEDSLGYLDYWKISKEDPNLKTVVLTEGNFNILCESHIDSLKIKDQVKVYASGNSFSYSSLLKSVCFDHNLYKCDVVILGDTDKQKWAYTNFLEENKHIMNSCKIYMNKQGKDFGIFPLKPTQIL